jgi:hypothetical protein
MANAWNSQTGPNADPENVSENWVTIEQEIIFENWVTIEREIIFENWVASDGWNWQRILIHDSQMKSIEKTESSLTHGIVYENCVTNNKKSSAKT